MQIWLQRGKTIYLNERQATHMGGERGNFKSRFFGGFDRRDVIGYIEELAAERNSLLKENECLKECIEETKLRIENEALSAKAENEAMMAEAAAASESAGKAISDAEATIRSLREKCASICADVEINISHARCEVNSLLDGLAGFSSAFKTADEKLMELEAFNLADKKED